MTDITQPAATVSLPSYPSHPRSSTCAPAISVLLPFRDAAPTLARCLDSLLTQSDPDFEIVAVDDGSTDEGAAIAGNYALRDARVRVVSQAPLGLVTALNVGLAACRGRFVARMDADDIALPHRLARQRAYLKAHSEIDLLGCLAEPFPDSENGEGRLSPGMTRYHEWMNALRDDGAIKRELFVESPLPHPSFFARREFFQALWGYRDLPWPEDYDLLLRAAERGYVFGKVPEVLLRRGDGPGRLTRTDPRYRREGMFRAKANFLMRGPWLRGMADKGARETGAREIVIGGSGTSGRLAARVLTEAGARVRCFLDNRVGPPGRRVMGLPAHGWPDDIPAAFFAEHRDAFFLSCIGESAGRERLRRHLERHGFIEGRDWLRFA
ncbi:MAG: glycosyltransferase family 2 protein [bacterium]